MKPFNLKTAKEGAPICTRDGRKAKILCFDLDNEDYKIAAAISMENHKGEKLETYTIEGRYEDISVEKPLDLMMVTEKKKGWIPIAWFGENKRGLLIFDTKEEAEVYYKDDEDYCIFDFRKSPIRSKKTPDRNGEYNAYLSKFLICHLENELNMPCGK